MRLLIPILALAMPLWAQDKAEKRADILASLDLPNQAQALRDKGAEKAQVKEALRAARGKKLKPKETRDLLKEASSAADENGTIDNFGTFVKSQLESGKRGRDLAAAIRAEHGKRGRGKGHMKEHQAKKREAKANRGKGKGKDKGKAKDKGNAKDKPKPKGRDAAGDADESNESGAENNKGRGKDKPGKGRGRGKGGK